MRPDLHRDFTRAALDARSTLKDVMQTAQSDFVREKAAVDLRQREFAARVAEARALLLFLQADIL